MGVVEWGALGVVITILITLGGVVVRLVDRLGKTDARADAANTRAESAAISAAAARLQMEMLERSVTEHRVHVAENYVSKDMLASLEDRILAAINKLGERIDRVMRNDHH